MTSKGFLGFRPIASIQRGFYHECYEKLNVPFGEPRIVESSGLCWNYKWNVEPLENCFRFTLAFTLSKGEFPADSNHHLWFEGGIELSGWTTAGYLGMPGYAYNGNRFASRRIPYSPVAPVEFRGRDARLLINDLPRFDIAASVSTISATGGHLTDTSIGALTEKGRAFSIRTSQKSKMGRNGFVATENLSKEKLTLCVSAPEVREGTRYRFFDMLSASPDRGIRPVTGETYTFEFEVHTWACDCVPEFWKEMHLRKIKQYPPQLPPHIMPLSYAATLVLSKFDRDNWNEENRTYITSPGGRFPFVAGWCGGNMNLHAILETGNEIQQKKALEALDWFLKKSPSASGIFYPRWDNQEKKFVPDYSNSWKEWRKEDNLVRRYGEIFIRSIRSLELLNKKNNSIPDLKIYENSLFDCAAQFVKIWKENGDFGHYIDADTGEVTVGNSSSGYSVSAGLAALSRYFKDKRKNRFLETACESADYYYRNFTRRGFTCGGPGDALSAPDSESGYAAIEAPMEIYEATGDSKWLRQACDAADLFASWVLGYEFEYPASSMFGKRKRTTCGAVWANVQNKHGAPGICTSSGDSLLRLYRATGEKRFLHLLASIVSLLPSYVSTTKEPFCDPSGKELPEGWMNERITTNDWFEAPGEIFYGSCSWVETALVLTRADLPSVYIDVENGIGVCFDQLELLMVPGKKEKEYTIRITNLTPFPARVKIMVEDENSKETAEGWRKFICEKEHHIAPSETLDGICNVENGVARFHKSSLK